MSCKLFLGAALLAVPFFGTSASESITWRKQTITQEFWAEGACVGDVNRDGHLDILSGPFWHEGPAFTNRHEIYPATARHPVEGQEGKFARGFLGFLSGRNGYSDNFLSFSADLNGDGWTDYLVVGFPGKETYWYENPGRAQTSPWRRHLALARTDNESPSLADITGDGKPELICMNARALGYASPDPEQPAAPWIWRTVGRNEVWNWNTHGLGYGDVNGDERIDLLTAHNWWEQPASLAGDALWKKHDAIFNNGGSQMFVRDVDGDGAGDVITAYEGHGYGLYWHQQLKDEKGARQWKRYVIAGSPTEPGETGIVFSQPHAVDLADVNRDGQPDIITGKRIWAHGPDGDADPNGAAVLYWFELQRVNGQAKFVGHLIDSDSGVGTQVMAADVNQDGKVDVVAANKKGLFVHFQTGR